MTFAVFDRATGALLRTGSCSADEVSAQVHEGEGFIAIPANAVRLYAVDLDVVRAAAIRDMPSAAAALTTAPGLREIADIIDNGSAA